MLNHEAGLLGLSGSSGDMRDLLAAGTAESEFAIAVFCYRARKYVGAYLAALGGADAILFGGGVGENAPTVRSAILSGLGFAGISLNDAENRAAVGTGGRVETCDSRIAIMVVPVDESRAMLRAARDLLPGDPAS